MPNVSSFGTQTDNAVVSGTVTDRQMIIPETPPQGLMSVGPRVTPHFVQPSLWSQLTTYHFFDAVHDAAGASYVAIKPEVPAGTELTDESYWFLWADPNSQFADLSELVKTFNGRITQNAADIATKAPHNHASEDTTYGVGNAANYGHVRLATESTPLTSGANEGIAATPQMINDNMTFESAPRNILMLGNSYTAGYNEASSPYAIMNQVKFAFNNVYYAGDSACGFVAYEGHAYDFNTTLRYWYSKNQQIASTITDIAINSAVGDSFCLASDAAYGTKASDTFNKILEFCKTNFPNLKRLRIFLCDALYKTARHSAALNVNASINEFVKLNRFFSNNYVFNGTQASYNFEVSYCGWIGLSLVGTELMNNSDNIHPSTQGYIYLSKLWLSAYNGSYNNQIKLLNPLSLDASEFANDSTLTILPIISTDTVQLILSLNVASNSVIKSTNNWAAVGNISNIIAKGNSTYIANVQPKVNFRISESGDVQLRGLSLDTDAINRNGVFVNYINIF